jgi:hypothetical protein
MTPAIPAVGTSQRIDINSSPDLDHWSQELGISRDELIKVVEITGDRSHDVADYLRIHGSPGNTA